MIIKLATISEFINYLEGKAVAYYMIENENWDAPYNVVEISTKAYMKLYKIGSTGRITTSYKLTGAIAGYYGR